MEKGYDEAAWLAKLYGPDVIIMSTTPPIPNRWALVDGNILFYYTLLMLDPHPPPEKIKKHWSIFNLNIIDDPNARHNYERVGCGLSPIDLWNVGVEYIYDGVSDGSHFN